MLTIAAAIGWNLFQDQLMRAAFVPSRSFTPPSPESAPDYTRAAAWLARPDLPDDPSRWAPPGVPSPTHPEVAVFYVSPTTYYSRDHWNARITDRESNEWLRLFASTQASAFNGVGAIWAPRYRQATLGAFLAESDNATQAIDVAYHDVERAWDAFVAQIPASRPIIIAGHSQGTVHLIRLLQERIADTAAAKRIVAAYLIGWPISIEADIPELGLEACSAPGQANCIISWQSFAEPADPHQLREIFERGVGLNGQPRKGTQMLCINPLTGAPGTAALASANRGMLMPNSAFTDAQLVQGTIPARCDPTGVLLIGRPPLGYNAYVMPGNNYHVFDYALFWGNLRADAEARTATYMKRPRGILNLFKK